MRIASVNMREYDTQADIIIDVELGDRGLDRLILARLTDEIERHARMTLVTLLREDRP